METGKNKVAMLASLALTSALIVFSAGYLIGSALTKDIFAVTAEGAIARYEEKSAERRGTVDINTASAAHLADLPGIGPVIAGRIIEYREQNGAFADVSELGNVKGIGEKTLEKLGGLITAG